jgi:hypothetical protein
MPASKRPSYLKRQKEQQRMARATEKREERRRRRETKRLTGDSTEENDVFADSPEGIEPIDDDASDADASDADPPGH